MKPFNLEEAKQGKPICTRDGRKARLICTDLKSPKYQIAAAVCDLTLRYEDIRTYTSKGEYTKDFESDHDLFMADEEPKCPFKPFDKVLARDNNNDKWLPDFFYRYAPDEDDSSPFYCLIDYYAQCIPYNEETAHLVGTTDDALEKYVIW